MANFEEAINFILKNEGGLVDNPADPGGLTNFGISLKFLKSLTFEELKKVNILNQDHLDSTIRSLDVDHAKLIYRVFFWKDIYEQVQCQRVINYFFDMVVNMWNSEATKILQNAINFYFIEQDALKVDGIFGEDTFKKIETVNLSTRQHELEFLSILVACRVHYYQLLVSRNSSLKVFLKGWINRSFTIS